MKNSDINDPIFLQAVEAIDAGDIPVLKKLIGKHPWLVTENLPTTEKGYFKDPYLLWFVADNPIRIPQLPANIVEVTRFLTGEVRRLATHNFQHQVDYALGLVVTGRIPRECGVQLDMMDVLIDAGAWPGSGIAALANHNIEAAAHLIARGGKLTLATAVGLKRMDEVMHLAPKASPQELLLALTVAAFYGNTRMLAFLLAQGAEPNGYPEKNSGFHAHATPLHQAVCLGSMEAVKLLTEAGARLDLTDHFFNGTPQGWAEHMQTVEPDEANKANFAAIAEYLKEKAGSVHHDIA